MSFRKIHRKFALIVFLPLFLSGSSGLAYRIGRGWFDLSANFGDLMMVIHEGRYLGEALIPVYVLLTGLGLIAMLASGMTLIRPKRRPAKLSKDKSINFRSLHRVLASIFCVPLFITALTGITYRLGNAWFGLSEQQAKFLLSVHQGSYFGQEFRVVYVLLLGVGLLFVLFTGLQMTSLIRRAQFKNNKLQN